jgi:hypothetical protein
MATAGGHVLTNKNLLTYRWRQATKSTHASQVQIGGLPRRAFAHYGASGGVASDGPHVRMLFVDPWGPDPNRS